MVESEFRPKQFGPKSQANGIGILCLFKLFIFIEREKHQPVASCTPPTGDLAGNSDMCLDWESNQRRFSLLN